MNMFDVLIKVSVYAENTEEAIDIMTEVLESESAVESYQFKTEDAAV